MKKRGLRKVLIIVVWLLVWEITAAIVHNPIYFAGPQETLRELFLMIKEGRFWLSVGASLLRIYAGLLIAFFCAWVCATAAWRFPVLDEILSPVISFLRSVPVAAIVVILLIWFGAKHLVLYISFMVIYPNLYGNFLTGYKSTDPRLKEMAQVFRVPTLKRFRYLYRPAYLPYLATAMPFCIGMGYKSGVAAEVIGLPIPSIGERIYSAKIYLNTAGVFAWIVVILLLNIPAEKLVAYILKKERVLRLRPRDNDDLKKETGMKAEQGVSISLEGIEKKYDDRTVLDIGKTEFEAGGICCIMGESGAGKTTLLKLLAGLTVQDAGSIRYKRESMQADTEAVCTPRIGMCFQENRLLKKADALSDLFFVKTTGTPEETKEALSELLPKELHEKCTQQLSGGEQRRVALARAVLSDSEILLLDEPFTGLDEESRIRAAAWILKYRRGRTTLLVTHDEGDVELMGARQYILSDGRLTEKQ